MNQYRHRARTAQVRAVSQVTLAIPSSDTTACFERVRMETLQWMALRAGRPLPKDAWAGRPFDLQDVGAQRTAATGLQSPIYWAARLDDADKAIPQRTWITEIGIGIRGTSEVLFGCRLYCVALGENPPYLASVPGFVRQIAAKFPSRVDGRLLTEEPWHVDNNKSADELATFLCSSTRAHPVIVVSEDRAESGYAVDALALARMNLGVAHVVKLTRDASYRLTDRLGKEFSVFDGAVRSYRAGFDPDLDEPSAHPLAFGSSIERWEGIGARAFEQFLVSQAMWESVNRRELEREVPSFASILVRAAHEVRAAAHREGQSASELLALASDELRQLEGRAEEERRTYEGLLAEAERERDEAMAMSDGARTEAANLRARVANLEYALLSEGRTESIELPTSFVELGDWAAKNLAGSIVVLNRALRAAKKSPFEDPQLAYKALLVLRDFYVPMRRIGNVGQKEAYEQQLAKLGLEESASFAGTRAAEHGNEYFVEYAGRRRELDRHLKGSNSRDPRFGFRVYFFWDEDSQQVIVGSLPSHLATRAS